MLRRLVSRSIQRQDKTRHKKLFSAIPRSFTDSTRNKFITFQCCHEHKFSVCSCAQTPKLDVDFFFFPFPFVSFLGAMRTQNLDRSPLRTKLIICESPFMFHLFSSMEQHR